MRKAFGQSCLKYAPLLLGLVLVLTWGACRNDFEYIPSSGNLQFSKDTVFLDTIFSNIGSSTYTLKVYNRSNDDILIPFVGLETGQSSSYRLNVDGQAGKEFNDIPLLAKDSLFVFIETTFDASQVPENEFLYTESLIFGTGASAQNVELVTLVKDAIFLYPSTLSNGTKEQLSLGTGEDGEEIFVEGFFLELDELDFSSEKPYVIYGYAAVSEGNTLIIPAGARVHFHSNSGLIINNGASLQVLGTLSTDRELLENEVIFEGDRLEPEFANTPGQWGTIWLRKGSVGNQIEHLTIKNATIGLQAEGDGLLDSPTLTLKNTQIYNSLTDNLRAKSSHIIAENTVLGSAGGNSFYGTLGGIYSFTHCTLANYWTNGFRSGTALGLDNFSESDTGAQTGDLQKANFINCIVDGSQSTELQLFANTGADFNFNFKNCLIKFNTGSGQPAGGLYNFEDTAFYENVLLNEEPDFLMPFENKFEIGENSAAIDAATSDILPLIPVDILGIDRIPDPDVGAHEFSQNN